VQIKHQIALYLLFYAATNGLGGSPKLRVFSCLLQQHATVDRNAVWNLRSHI